MTESLQYPQPFELLFLQWTKAVQAFLTRSPRATFWSMFQPPRLSELSLTQAAVLTQSLCLVSPCQRLWIWPDPVFPFHCYATAFPSIPTYFCV